MKLFTIFLLLFFISVTLFGQDNLLDHFNNDDEENIVFATFKGTKVINLQSVEMSEKNELQFIISHRFGTLNSGIYNLFGLDYGKIRLSLDYGLTDNIDIGIARSSFDKIIDASTKIKIISQGKNNSPVSLVTYSSLFLDPSESNKIDYFIQRLSYVNQLIIARKFNPNFSFQISPSFIHYNLVRIGSQDHDLLAIGFGGRYKFNKSISFNIEWIPLISELENMNSLSFGFDIETGGHVFQLLLSNSTAMYETGFITQNHDSWKDAGVHFGFNISRVFNF